MSRRIHFAHGNGFPSGCYRQLLTKVAKHIDITDIDMIGHDAFPVTDNWVHLVDELIESIEKTGNGPVIAVGHSLGGALSLMASLKRPDLMTQVIMLDSPIIDHVKSCAVRLIKKLGLIDHVTPAKRTKNRKNQWKDREQVEVYLRQKALFKRFSPACMQDYIDYGLIKNNQGEYCLKFDRQIEYLIYRTLPHRLPMMRVSNHCPVTMIYGGQSDVVSWYDVLYMRWRWGVKTLRMSGTHMFPFEYPELAANAILDVINIK